MIHRIRLLLLLTAAFIALTAHGAFAAQGEIIVAKSGGDFTSIQAAINSVTPTASNPYVIKVMPGTYTENVIMKSYISLQGAGRETTTIASPVLTGGTVVVDIYGVSQVSVSGFTITNGANGIRNHSSSKVTITENTLRNNYMTGIYNLSTGETTITGNNVVDHVYVPGVWVIGITVYNSTGPITIENNYIARSEFGISVCDSTPKIIGNHISANNHEGINIYCTSKPEILSNTLTENGVNIGAWDNSAPLISGNIITGTGGGIQCRGSSTGSIIGNVITGHQGSGVTVGDSAAPQISHNRITGNATYFTYSYDVHISTSGAPNISFNVYDTLYGTAGVGLYNVKSDGTPAPAP